MSNSSAASSHGSSPLRPVSSGAKTGPTDFLYGSLLGEGAFAKVCSSCGRYRGRARRQRLLHVGFLLCGARISPLLMHRSTSAFSLHGCGAARRNRSACFGTAAPPRPQHLCRISGKECVALYSTASTLITSPPSATSLVAPSQVVHVRAREPLRPGRPAPEFAAKIMEKRFIKKENKVCSRFT